jgi:bisphosphoglycerate-dependent phosphoglycerate mutase
MKTLFLIRHAKSSWDDTALPDKDRPLNDRGKRDAPKMGKRLAKRDVKPDLILSSPAKRALTTAEIIAKKLDYKLKDIVVDDRLYAGAVHDLLNVIHKLGDKPKRVIPGRVFCSTWWLPRGRIWRWWLPGCRHGWRLPRCCYRGWFPRCCYQPWFS